MQDYTQAHAYLNALTGGKVDTTLFDFRAIHDTNKGTPAINRRGTLAQFWHELVDWNGRGYGVFVMINETDGNGRLLTNITGVRAHVADLDNLSAMQNLQRAMAHTPAPSFFVQTSPNKAHVYWPMHTPYCDNAYYDSLQRRIVQYFDSDPAVIDATRVLRVPGFYHNKGVPHLVTFTPLGFPPSEIIALATSLQHVNVVNHYAGSSRNPLGTEKLAAPSFASAREELFNISPVGMPRDEWIKVMCAFKQAAWNHADDDEIYRVFCEWCEQYETNDVRENHKQYMSIRDTQLGYNHLRQMTTAAIRFAQSLPTIAAFYSGAVPPPPPPSGTPLNDMAAAIPVLPPLPPEPVVQAPSEPGERFNAFVTAEDQRRFFKGCFIVTRSGMIFTPDARLMNQTQFNARYGGHMFELGDGKVTDEPWKAATRNTLGTVPKVDHMRFLPEHVTGAVVGDELGRLGVNTYRPAIIRRRPGDVSPYLRHVERLIGNAEDAKTLHDFYAHSFKHPGYKITWAPLIQSTEGAGKGVLKNVIEHCVGSAYTHVPKAQELAESGAKFNAWQRNKLFIIVDEIRVDEKRDMVEVLKPMITERQIEIQAKGQDQDKEDNAANWQFFSNWRDAIPVHQNGRRFSIFYSPLQTVADLNEAGMNEAYFGRLWGWLENGGYEMIAHYYNEYDMPRGGVPSRAPNTASTNEALRISRGPVERAIDLAIEDEVAGFRGGWVSMYAVQARLKERGQRISSEAFIEQILQGMGYIAIGRAARPYFQENPTERSMLFSRDREADVNRYGEAQGYNG